MGQRSFLITDYPKPMSKQEETPISELTSPEFGGDRPRIDPHRIPNVSPGGLPKMFDVQPKDLDEALALMMHQAANQKTLRDALEQSDSAMDFRTTVGGRQFRNQWRLWKGMAALLGNPFPKESDPVPDNVGLVDSIHERTGLVHADDLSAYLLSRFWSEYMVEEWDEPGYIKSIHVHWTEYNAPQFDPFNYKLAT